MGPKTLLPYRTILTRCVYQSYNSYLCDLCMFPLYSGFYLIPLKAIWEKHLDLMKLNLENICFLKHCFRAEAFEVKSRNFS